MGNAGDAGVGNMGDAGGVGATGATGGAPDTTPRQPAGWDDDIRLPVAPDINPDPGVVEVNLDAAPTQMTFVPGGPTTVWTYNQQIPGPLIRARAGDRVIVHVTNDLSEDTTVHWHGVRVPFAMDGVPDVSQPAIIPGASFDYDFVVPDASLFWYHPHFDSAAQVGFGLYGPLLVDDPNEPKGIGDEVVMVLSDIAVMDDGTIQPPDVSGPLASVFGREGNILLVNGKNHPTLKARPGLRQRWRVVNAAKTRYFQLSLAGHTFTRIGGDGGLMSHPVDVAEPVVAPGERADLLITPTGNPGDELVVRWLPFDRGYGATLVPIQDLMTIHLEGEPAPTPPLPELHRDITPIDTTGATPLSVDLTDAAPMLFKLGLNGIPFEDSVPFEAHVGETQVWTLTDQLAFDHPMHLHGFFFQVLDDDGNPRDPMEWKDTVNVRVNGSAKFAVRYEDRPGMWMFHCHILDHAEIGMMGMVHVAPVGE